ncbi:carboxy terminal-processing peptidase [Pelistega europaea]|uniref:Carboxy terminal-processing peptidase n=1 Tax=Pelistega europaea TaxID=106147 RepID=A0A7Y4LD34_9BURK|nr:carboxy terminal-processing peptidase [Pelistega europaea]NOL50227.1 carboxy terminal-processing peptidase [Pelistega europaea]
MKKYSTTLKSLVLATSLAWVVGGAYADTLPSGVSQAVTNASQTATIQVATNDDKSKETSSSKVAPIKPADFPKIQPEIEFSRASFIVSNVLTRLEYNKKPLDGKMSEEVYKAYFKLLDPQKMFFTAEDLAHYQPAESLVSRMLLAGDMRFAFDVFLRYRDRVAQRYDYAISLLEQPFDFSVDEQFNVDRKKADWPKNDDEVNDLWRRRVKNDFIRLKLTKTDDAKIRETLRKRYTNHRNQLVRMTSEEVAEMFLNSYADSTDPHTTYYSPSSAKDFDVQMSLSVEGIGAVLQKRDEYGQIREVVAGGPAAKDGRLQPGDRIVAVGQGEDGAMEDVVDWRLEDIVKKIRGKRGSVVRIEVIPAEGGLDGKHRVIRIVRDKVLMEEQAARSKMLETDIDGVKRKIGVIIIPSFYEDFDGRIQGTPNYKSVTRDVEKILTDYKKDGVEGVVLDLRGNGGGSLNEAANLTGLFIGDKQTVVQVRSADGDVNNVRSRNVEKLWDKPVVVIVDRTSASASEIFAAAIQDYSRGVVVGDRTWGKGTVQTFRSLSDFLRDPNPTDKDSLGALKWTIQKFFRVNGGSTQVKGVTPDIKFPSMFDKEDLGEASYDNAMPWTAIQPASYKPLASLSEEIKTLKARHDKRIKTSGSWQLMEDETSYALKLSQRKSYSLNLVKREAEREKMNETYKDFEKRRKDLGEKDLATFKLDDGLAAGEGNLKQELEDEKKRKENLDVIVRESANIASDMVALKVKR